MLTADATNKNPAFSTTSNSDGGPARSSGSGNVYHSLDAWRGVAALWVVIYHATAGTISENPSLVTQNPFWSFCRWGYLGVEMFFVISGFCIAAAVVASASRNGTILSYLRARLRRIFPPYWAAFALFLLFGYGLAEGARRGVLPAQALQNPLVWLVSDAHLPVDKAQFYILNLSLMQLAAREVLLCRVFWTLCYELAFYLVCGALLWAVLAWTKRAASRTRQDATEGVAVVEPGALVLTLLHGVTILCCLWLFVSPARVPYPFDFWPLFGAGAALYQLLMRRASAPASNVVRWLPRATLGMVALALTSCAFLHPGAAFGPEKVSGMALFVSVPPFVLALALLHAKDAALMRNRIVGVLSFVGVFSYSLYLTHFISISLARAVLAAAGWRNGGEGWKLLIVTLVSVGAAYLFHCLFERPFMSSKARRRASEEAAALAAFAPTSAAKATA